MKKIAYSMQVRLSILAIFMKRIIFFWGCRNSLKHMLMPFGREHVDIAYEDLHAVEFCLKADAGEDGSNTLGGSNRC